MSTELHAALRQAVTDAPFDEFDVHRVMEAGARRVRRRTAWTAGTAALAVVVAATVTSLVVSGSRDSEPRPAELVRLDLTRAGTQDLTALSSVRTTWRDPANELDHDRFEGLTSDGFALRSRYTHDGQVYELGLLDPATGATDWLPTPPMGAETVVELTSERLAIFARRSAGRGALLIFDRGSRIWTSIVLRVPQGLEAHSPYRLAMGSDGRLYLGSTDEGEAGPINWWSYSVSPGGARREEPSLAGSAVAWRNGVMVLADSDGRVTTSSAGVERVVAEERPAGCQTPADPALASMAPLVGLAGDRPVVTYSCDDPAQAVTYVYDDDGAAVQVDGASLLAAHEGHVLLGSGAAGHGESGGGTYLLDLDTLDLSRVAPGLHDSQVGLDAGLVLWNEPGPLDDGDVYDVVWKVARLPVGGGE